MGAEGFVARALVAPLLVAALAAASAPAAEAAAPRREVVYVQPLGDGVPQDAVELVSRSLLQFYGLHVHVLPPVPLPAAAFYPEGGRYRAERLVEHLARELPRDGYRVLGLTIADVSTTGRTPDWGVMGLARLGGRAGVVSLYRCWRGAGSAGEANVRFAKIAVHELGHTLGLEHCPEPGCLLADAQGKVSTVDAGHDLCEACRARLRAAGRPLRDDPLIPWAEPALAAW